MISRPLFHPAASDGTGEALVPPAPVREEKHLKFGIGELSLFVPVSGVREITRYSPSTLLTSNVTPKNRALIGAVNLRARIVPVLDIRETLKERKPTEGSPTDLVTIVVIYNKSNPTKPPVGFVVDSVDSVLELKFTDTDFIDPDPKYTGIPCLGYRVTPKGQISQTIGYVLNPTEIIALANVVN